jgi:acyl-CoA dehydrogenase
MSDTEREALEAGTVWWDGELFRGNPDWNKLLAYPVPKLTAAEQSFMDNEVEEACRLVDDWKVSHETQDMTPEAWKYIKDNGFLGMIIPKKYGGLEFSAYAHSQVVTKLSTRSSALSVSVMVPNSLGPAELLLHYGTDEQKNHYLPRLAKGVEIPAFALTSPWAGSDAASIPDVGIVCKGMWQGKEVLGMRVTWDKRYITLGPVCTILGLAFHLYDPDGLLGEQEAHRHHLCAGSSRHPGSRHRPSPLPAQRHVHEWPDARQGCFHAARLHHRWPEDGRPGLAHADGVSGRRSFDFAAVVQCRHGAVDCPRGRWLCPRSQPVQDGCRSIRRCRRGALTRIGAYTYMMDAVRKMTAGAVDLGEKPSVVSAIAKYHVTERARQVVNDGMDIVGGKGICLGPSNFMGRAYQQIPIGITVEGANILTRSLILFGQGAIRCHPYVLKEMQAAHQSGCQTGAG